MVGRSAALLRTALNSASFFCMNDPNFTLVFSTALHWRIYCRKQPFIYPAPPPPPPQESISTCCGGNHRPSAVTSSSFVHSSCLSPVFLFPSLDITPFALKQNCLPVHSLLGPYITRSGHSLSLSLSLSSLLSVCANGDR